MKKIIALLVTLSSFSALANCQDINGYEISDIMYADLSSNPVTVNQARYVGKVGESNYELEFTMKDVNYYASLNSKLTQGKVLVQVDDQLVAVARVSNGTIVCN
jgi:hypothetical protein